MADDDERSVERQLPPAHGRRAGPSGGRTTCAAALACRIASGGPNPRRGRRRLEPVGTGSAGLECCAPEMFRLIHHAFGLPRSVAGGEAVEPRLGIQRTRADRYTHPRMGLTYEETPVQWGSAERTGCSIVSNVRVTVGRGTAGRNAAMKAVTGARRGMRGRREACGVPSPNSSSIPETRRAPGLGGYDIPPCPSSSVAVHRDPPTSIRTRFRTRSALHQPTTSRRSRESRGPADGGA